jgi:hypothetical protein
VTPIGPGTLLAGRFTLEDQLDEYEGAKVWRATDRILARDVAVHVIAADDPRAEALLTAARTSANVTDGHLLRVLDAASVDGVAYVVNEWVAGVTLDRLLADGPLSPRRAAWVAKEVAEALSAAHRHGIAHGRLLPENVMVTDAGSVKLIGFVVDAVLRGREVHRVTGGDPLGEHEADVVNLAGLLYAGLVARWPGTEGCTLPDAPAEHGLPLRPRQVRAGVPRPLDAICERVLNHGGHSQTTPIETAHEVYAALCDYIGDPAGAPAGFAAMAGDEPGDTVAVEIPAADATDAAPHDAKPRESSPAGLEQETQAGAPVFYDDDTGVGWAPGAEPVAAERRSGSPGDRGGDPEATEISAPPPPLPEPEPKPLFASEEPRRPHEPRPARREQSDPPPRSIGASNGPLPQSWGPDADGPPPAQPSDEWRTASWDSEPPGRSWLRLAGALAGVLAVIVAIVFAFNLGRDSAPDPREASQTTETSESPEPDPQPVPIAAVTDFDPDGDGQENPETARLAADGKAGTAWTTVTYFDPLPLQKEGVGLLLDLGEPVKVDDVGLRLGGSPTTVELLVPREASNTPPDDLQDLRRVARVKDAGENVRLEPKEPVTTEYLVVWLTDLPAVGSDFRGEVAEIVVRA